MTSSTIGTILLLILGVLLATVWAVHFVVQLLGIVLAVASAIWLIRLLT